MEAADRPAARRRSRRPGLERAVLSHPETLAHLCLFDPSVEEWPVANPFVASPALLDTRYRRRDAAGRELPRGARDAQPRARRAVPLVRLTSAPAPEVELEAALRGLAGGPGAGRRRGRVAPRSGSPTRCGRRARSSSRSTSSSCARAASSSRSSWMRSGAPRACSDVVQGAVEGARRAGRTEAEVAATAQAMMASDAGRRVPAILTVTTGEATVTGGWEATERAHRSRATWCSATRRPGSTGTGRTAPNAVCAGRAEHEQRRIFDRVRRALELAIRLCRPGAMACEHRRGRARGARRPRADLRASHRPRHRRLLVRAAAHHAVRAHQARGGHGARASSPRSTPPGFGGIRLEHVFVVRAGGNEILTRFGHTL